VLELYRANLKNLNWGVEYLAREAQQQACQQEAEVRERQRIVAIEKHGQDYKSFCAAAQERKGFACKWRFTCFTYRKFLTCCKVNRLGHETAIL
jgi:hypothetical protein